MDAGPQKRGGREASRFAGNWRDPSPLPPDP